MTPLTAILCHSAGNAVPVYFMSLFDLFYVKYCVRCSLTENTCLFFVFFLKVQPLPDFHLPEKKVAEPTKPAPFKLPVDEQGTAKTERWEPMVRSFAISHLLLLNALLYWTSHIQCVDFAVVCILATS